MKVTSGALFVGLALALGGASTAGGEEVPVTLPEALALADRANPELQAIDEDVHRPGERTRLWSFDVLEADWGSGNGEGKGRARVDVPTGSL